MTKADIVSEISKSTGIDKQTVLASVESFMDIVKSSLAQGENVYLRGFGSFVIKKRAQKTARNISKSTGIDKQTVLASVESFMDIVKSSLAQGENVYLRGFGSFVIKKRAQKTARNISKNTTIIIPEHNIPSFKPAKTFIGEVK